MNKKIHFYVFLLCSIIIIISYILSIKNNMICLPPFNNLLFPTTCVFKMITGLNCPFCGLTRSFVALSHLQFLTAWELNRAGVFIYLLVLWQLPYRIFCIIIKEAVITRSLSLFNIIGCGLAVTMLAINWILHLLVA